MESHFEALPHSPEILRAETIDLGIFGSDRGGPDTESGTAYGSSESLVRGILLPIPGEVTCFRSYRALAARVLGL